MSVRTVAVDRATLVTKRAGSVNQLFGIAFGAVYVVVGLAGFAVTGGLGLTAPDGHNLIVFGVNPLHNLVHAGIGVALVGGALLGLRWSRRINGSVGAVYLGVGMAGLFLLGTDANIIALNHADNGLHFASALSGLLVALRADRVGAAGAALQPIPEAPPTAAVIPAVRVGKQPLQGGSQVPGSGTYRCSCGDFAAWVRKGGRLPECPVGSGHYYKRTHPKPGAATRSAS